MFPSFRDSLVRQARHLGLAYSGEFAMAYLGSGTASPAPPSLAEVDVIGPLAVAGVPQLSATLADRHLRPPLGPPVSPSSAPGGEYVPPLHPGLAQQVRSVVVVSEPVRMVTVEVHPFDAVGVPGCAVTTDTVVIAASRGRWFADFGCRHPIARRPTPKGRPEGHPATSHHVEFAAGAPECETHHRKVFPLYGYTCQ